MNSLEQGLKPRLDLVIERQVKTCPDTKFDSITPNDSQCLAAGVRKNYRQSKTSLDQKVPV